MLAIKVTTWSDPRGSETSHTYECSNSGLGVTIRKINYCTHAEYWSIVKDKFNTGQIPITFIGDEPRDENNASLRSFLYCHFYTIEGEAFSFILNFGYLYLIQNGKTIDKYYINDQNDHDMPPAKMIADNKE